MSLRGERVRDHVRAVTVRERDQHDEAGLAFHERRHRVHPFPHQEVTFPMAGHGPVVGFGGPFPNVERAAQLALPVHHRVTARPTRRVPRPQISGQFLPQRSPRLHEQRHIDRLVRHTHLRLVRELLHQPTRDLGR